MDERSAVPTDLARVQSLVCANAAAYAAARRCCDALNGISAGDVQHGRVPTKDLVRIYTTRLSRPQRADWPEGSADLLQRLETAQVNTDGFVWESHGFVYCVFTNPDVTMLVACLVGRDRRAVSPSP